MKIESKKIIKIILGIERKSKKEEWREGNIERENIINRRLIKNK